MKKLILILLITGTFLSCKNDPKQGVEQDDNYSTAENNEVKELTGEFVYFADAAVLQMPHEIYGVVINDKMKELDKKAQQFKKDPTDGVDVTIKGKIIHKGKSDEDWEYYVEVLEIIKVLPTKEDKNSAIKLENNQ